jgi:hypothetical protein
VTGDAYWIMTVGAPIPGDPRDGELHQCFGSLPDHFDLEPWEEVPGAVDARYVRAAGPPVIDEQGRTVWVYEFRPANVQ